MTLTYRLEKRMDKIYRRATQGSGTPKKKKVRHGLARATEQRTGADAGSLVRPARVIKTILWEILGLTTYQYINI